MGLRAALVCYGVLNAILYASLLPLWEGFDEPFHYGYVQSLSHGCGFPVLGRTTISQEVWGSIALAPASSDVKRNLPVVTTYDEWFRLEPAERIARRTKLEKLNGGAGCVADAPLNYEAQQAPLAYLLLAAPDWLWSRAALVERVWRLRLLCAILSSLATALIAFRLARQLSVPETFAAAAVFVILSLQMFYAATAHVANDWLAIPLGALVVSLVIGVCQRPGTSSAAALAGALGAGLLTKAYLLALAPVACGAVLWLVWKRRLGWRAAGLFAGLLLLIAGPWYARNLSLYGSLTAMQETVRRGSVSELASVALQVPWPRVVVASARAALWTGNNSITEFWAPAEWLMLAAIIAALVLYAVKARRSGLPAAEHVTLVACGLWVAALGYSALINFWSTQGEYTIASPWYAQVLLPFGFCLLFLGLSRGQTAGRAIAIGFVCLWGCVIAATYVVKLIPLYTGFTGSAHAAEIVRWYVGWYAGLREALENTAMRGPGWIFSLTALVVLGAFCLGSVLITRLIREFR
jgi:hypothetical protein